MTLLLYILLFPIIIPLKILEFIGFCAFQKDKWNYWTKH